MEKALAGPAVSLGESAVGQRGFFHVRGLALLSSKGSVVTNPAYGRFAGPSTRHRRRVARAPNAGVDGPRAEFQGRSRVVHLRIPLNAHASTEWKRLTCWWAGLRRSAP